MASDRQSARTRENFYIALIFRHNNFVRVIKKRYVCCSISCFFNEVSFTEFTTFARFCKQNRGGKKSVMPVGVYQGIIGR